MRHIPRIAVVWVAALVAVSAIAVIAVRPGSEALAVSRVQASPLPTPTPTPSASPETEAEAASETEFVSSHCPELDNPPGNPVAQAPPGPSPTDGAIAIPAIGVEAPLVRVGVRDGEMVIPRTAHEVAWLDGGSFPGPRNNAILAGHHDWNRRLGSFYRLGELRKGQEVVVRLGGRQWTFRIAWICSFDRNTPETPRILGPADVPSVTLITCGGVFDRSAGTHRERIVVRAEMVGRPQAV